MTECEIKAQKQLESLVVTMLFGHRVSSIRGPSVLLDQLLRSSCQLVSAQQTRCAVP